MALVLNEEQRLLKDTAKDFLSANMPVEALRKLRDSDDEMGYSREHWQQMCELGWASIVLPEEYDGLAPVPAAPPFSENFTESSRKYSGALHHATLRLAPLRRIALLN